MAKAHHLHMRRGSGLRVAVLSVTAVALLVLLSASGALAAATPSTVALHVTVNGSGTVRVPGNPAFTCRASFPTSSHCRHTFQVRKGRRIAVKESPASGWKLWKWAGACHGSAASCSLRVTAPRFGFVTASFVPPGDRLNPYPLGTPATVSDGLGKWSMRILSASEQGGDLIVSVQATLAPSVPNSWTLGLDYATFLTVRDGDELATDQCLPPAPDFLLVGADVDPWGPGYVQGGQTVTGNLCFANGPLAPRDLFFVPATQFPPEPYLDGVPNEPPAPPPFQSVWFALR